MEEIKDTDEAKKAGGSGFAVGGNTGSKEDRYREWRHFHHRRTWMFGWLVVLALFVILVFGLLFAGFNGHRREMDVGRFGENMDTRIGGRGFGMMGGMRGARGGSLTAKVNAVNGQTLIVDDAGTSRTIQISSTTRFSLSSTTKIATGDTITVIGSQDSGGVIQADLIYVNP
ncbi:MAG TPA: hypothetical protein VMQ44_02490 [Candidatus Saccharimonadales bacterium]|nr:hypothetical protein [Candidatus Saccharimonadales bacterium]